MVYFLRKSFSLHFSEKVKILTFEGNHFNTFYSLVSNKHVKKMLRSPRRFGGGGRLMIFHYLNNYFIDKLIRIEVARINVRARHDLFTTPSQKDNNLEL